MILDTNQIKDLLLNNPNKDLVAKAKVNNKKLRMHIYGDGLQDEIIAIDGHEKEELKNLRKKYAKSNKDLFARLARPIDKVFSARGGSVYYNMAEANNKKARLLSMNVRDGLGIFKWIETKWKPHSLDDPNGIIFMEIGDPIDNTVNTYPTYKSITTVYDYLPKGTALEYIVFIVPASEKIKNGFKKEDIIYRVVDDAFDYWIKVNDETIKILNDHTFPNYFEVVPAILNSDFSDPEYDGMMLSLFSDVIELANDFIQTGSIRNLAKLRMAYPKYWEYADDCPVCKGITIVEGKDCTTCNGTGKKLMVSPGDAKLLVYPDGKDVPTVAPNVAGFVAFPKEYFDYSTIELSDIENIMSLTVWGTETKKQTNGMAADQTGTVKTATQVVDDIQPKADRLQAISEMAEKRAKFIMDHVIMLAIDSSYKGSSINYGRRYMIESVDEVWKKYSDARLAGCAVSVLDDLLMEYVETKYKGDRVSMDTQVKLLYIEPFVHFTIQQVQTFNIPFEDFCKKLYFGEWLATLSEAALLSTNIEDLRQQLVEYVAAKNIPKPIPETNPAFN